MTDVKTDVKTAESSGGFSFFQLFVFLVATSSVAMNFAIIYGVIPIQGKYCMDNVTELLCFMDEDALRLLEDFGVSATSVVYILDFYCSKSITGCCFLQK